MQIEWNSKAMKTDVLVVDSIQPTFMGGIDKTKSFRIQLTEIDNKMLRLSKFIHVL